MSIRRRHNCPRIPAAGLGPTIMAGMIHLGLPSMLVMLTILLNSTTSSAQGPNAPKWLPESTVAYLCIDDVPELLARLGDTAMARMLDDPQVKPFVDQLYGSAAESFRDIERDLNLSLGQLKSIFRGEFCIAAVIGEDGSPTLVMMVEVGDQLPNARKIINFIQARMEARGDVRTRERSRDTELTILARVDSPDRKTVFLEHDDTMMVTSNVAVAQQALAAWQGDSESSLATNRRFDTIMKQCGGSADERPQLTYFLDPLGLVKGIASNNFALQMGLTTVQPLGFDGFQAMGGSLLLGGRQFESLHHTHILLDTPRTGILEMIALRSGDMSPEPWAPNDVATYTTMHWDMPASCAAFARAFDSFRGPGAFDRSFADPFLDRFGVDLEKEVLAAFDGRVTRVTWMNESSQVQTAATLVGLKLKNPAQARATLRKVVGHTSHLLTKYTIDGVDCYESALPTTPQSGASVIRNLPISHIAILGDHLLLTNREALLERAIETKHGVSPPLGQELDFILNASKITRLPGGKTPVMTFFERPEVRLLSTYEILRSEDTRQRLSELASQNRLIGALSDALDNHPVPPFAVLAKYFAFSGRLVTSDAAGIHSIGFTFRRK